MIYRVRRVVAILATAVTIMACGSQTVTQLRTEKKMVNNPTFILHIDREFSGPEHGLIVEGFKNWEQVTNGIVRFVIAKHQYDAKMDVIPNVSKGECTYDVYVTRAHSTANEVKMLDKYEGISVLGFTSSNCASRTVALVYDRLTSTNLFKQVAFHEAGHTIGLDHIPVPKESAMFPSVDKATTCATLLDMKQLCMLYDCDFRKMRYCDAE
jgi:hypothetical protein